MFRCVSEEPVTDCRHAQLATILKKVLESLGEILVDVEYYSGDPNYRLEVTTYSNLNMLGRLFGRDIYIRLVNAEPEPEDVSEWQRTAHGREPDWRRFMRNPGGMVTSEARAVQGCLIGIFNPGTHLAGGDWGAGYIRDRNLIDCRRVESADFDLIREAVLDMARQRISKKREMLEKTISEMENAALSSC